MMEPPVGQQGTGRDRYQWQAATGAVYPPAMKVLITASGMS